MKIIPILAFSSLLIFASCNQKTMNTSDTHTQRLVGGWQTTEVTPDVENAVNFVLGQMNTASKLDEIVQVKTQVVNGLNYDIDFKLENGEIWNVMVYRDLKGNFTMTKTAQLKK
ncbi:hypothetical protein UJ101_00101 [Flavobacteriaceae bacterium UJ101]|nr:hypothetical protein UJ101_00101 [Flavobacteriaceae bacterium UJ101]